MEQEEPNPRSNGDAYPTMHGCGYCFASAVYPRPIEHVEGCGVAVVQFAKRTAFAGDGALLEVYEAAAALVNLERQPLKAVGACALSWHGMWARGVARLDRAAVALLRSRGVQ